LKAFILTNPYVPLCTPMVLVILQFVTAVLLFDNGLPFYFLDDAMHSSLLLVAFFALSMVAFPAILLGVRQIVLSANKFVPAMGLLLNTVYLLGFLSFFILVFLTQTLT
jgi:hypothetical protein